MAAQRPDSADDEPRPRPVRAPSRSDGLDGDGSEPDVFANLPATLVDVRSAARASFRAPWGLVRWCHGADSNAMRRWRHRARRCSSTSSSVRTSLISVCSSVCASGWVRARPGIWLQKPRIPVHPRSRCARAQGVVTWSGDLQERQLQVFARRRQLTLTHRPPGPKARDILGVEEGRRTETLEMAGSGVREELCFSLLLGAPPFAQQCRAHSTA
jgi:hypothetical protein